MGGKDTVSRRQKSVIQYILLVISVLSLFVGMKNSILSINHEQKSISRLKFSEKSMETKLIYTPFYVVGEGSYYLVLPSSYKTKVFNAEIVWDSDYYSLYIDEKNYRNGDVWSDNLNEEIHRLKIVDLFGKIRVEKDFQVLVSANIPSIMVTVEAKKELFSSLEFANKQYIEKGEIIVLDENGAVVLQDTMERFKVRGNLTADLSKKPFTFTLSQPKAICDMPASVNWHLIANATDSSHIRNKIMLDWAQELSERYTPTGEYVDLYVNGEYQGLYLLTETMETSTIRINRDPLNSILLEMELDYRAIKEDNYLSTEREHYWVIHEASAISDDKKEEVTAYLNNIESALYSERGVGAESGKKLEELLDFDSWTDTWLLKEVSSDHDLGTTSQFAIIEDWNERSILKAGPEWDFDATLGNGMVPWSVNPRNLVTAIWNTKGIKSTNQNKWLAQMYKNTDFRTQLIEKYVKEFQPKIKRLLENEIDAYAQKIRRPAILNALRWVGNGVYDDFNKPESFQVGTEKDYRVKYDILNPHIDMIKEFLEEKDNFLTQLWIEGIEFEVYIEEHNEEGMNLELNNDIYTWIPKVGQ